MSDGQEPISATPAISTAKTKEPRQHPKYKDDDADITLISSDNVAFKVHSYRLQAASAVFRSMISISTQATSENRTIHLTDSRIERSRTLQAVLGILYFASYKPKFPINYHELDMIAFAFKYEMTVVNNHVALDLHRRSTPGKPSDERDCSLRLAWELKDPHLLEHTLRDNLELRSSRTNDDPYDTDLRPRYTCDEVYKGLEDGLELDRRWSDPSELTYDEALHFPVSLLWIMMQATRVARSKTTEEAYKEAYMKEARRLVKLALPEDEDVDDDDESSNDENEEENNSREAKRVRR